MIILIVPNEEKEGWHSLPCHKKVTNTMVTFIVYIIFILLE